MAFMQCEIFSEKLGLMTGVNVIIPREGQNEGKRPIRELPVLWLLHGLSDNSTCWSRFTSVERYADDYGVAVIMPEVARSFYNNMEHGLRFYDYVSAELPAQMRRMFGFSDKREKNFVAGLSMGGFGAMKLALRNPSKFAAAATLSGAVMPTAALVEHSASRGVSVEETVRQSFGRMSAKVLRQNDLYMIIESQLEKGAELPKLYQYCGTEDFLYDANTGFRDFLREKKIDAQYVEGPGGHEWKNWDIYLERFLYWLKSGGLI